MRRNDFWGAGFYVLLAAATVLLCASGGLGRFNQAMPYLAGFIQFAVYATAGELLSTRILEGIWAVNRAVWFKAATWGIGGVFVTLAFTLFSAGTKQAMADGLLPFASNALALAFFTSCTNNLFFAPLHSALMRVCGNYAELRFLHGRRPTIQEAVDSVDWGELVDFTLFKTIPCFWIPVNTVSFLLPEGYRVVSAAMLSLVFGILMTILKLRERKNKVRKESVS
ncbi:MAG: hypothetical protein KHX40_11450 [Oscillospiraceae bacterium]|nr:hypothetical protein [Oscillospiraceae bacterium]